MNIINWGLKLSIAGSLAKIIKDSIKYEVIEDEFEIWYIKALKYLGNSDDKIFKYVNNVLQQLLKICLEYGQFESINNLNNEDVTYGERDSINNAARFPWNFFKCLKSSSRDSVRTGASLLVILEFIINDFAIVFK